MDCDNQIHPAASHLPRGLVMYGNKRIAAHATYTCSNAILLTLTLAILPMHGQQQMPLYAC